MKNNSSLNNKVDTAFESIENITRATPSPWFYTKLMQKINQPHATTWEKLVGVLLLPRVALAIIFVIIINAFVLYLKFYIHTASPDLSEISISDEYSLASVAMYDLENEKP